jgi:uncharacterized membrane protein
MVKPSHTDPHASASAPASISGGAHTDVRAPASGSAHTAGHSASVQPAPARGWFARLGRILRHRWMDEADTRRAVPPELLKRLEDYVTASEARHSGEVRICVEAGMPTSYLRRDATPRQRAIALFGKLRVWDTEHNNGVLIYLLLAEHAIELVADRGLNTKVSANEWGAITQHLSASLKSGQYEAGLTHALEEVSALLVQHYPLTEGQTRSNHLPNAPDLR